ncbi:MAG: hypothetical protein ACI84C_001039 [Flavobacteriales bacterium]|jgi:hypothetical protein
MNVRSIFILLLTLTLNSAAVHGQFAEFLFEDGVHKFPKTEEGDQLSHTFNFENTGDAPLIISSYKVECTCTIAAYSKEPILPGAKGSVVVTFDTNEKIGWQYRQIDLYANTKKSPTTLEIRVKILND